jgi:hypothetical protein
MVDLNSLSSAELADRIAILRDNIRQITEQATSQSGAADEDRNAERMTRLNDDLESLLKGARAPARGSEVLFLSCESADD